ncbi:hypothetical protein [Psychromonas ossibalaenae]|uniref:hypothetical protein n=1 Tax=Psychromonas ossibalaenae TaxID=444922 RepID=UPI00036F105F|nr:hypothetical protein [Psychromonas ossibalaenae]
MKDIDYGFYDENGIYVNSLVNNYLIKHNLEPTVERINRLEREFSRHPEPEFKLKPSNASLPYAERERWKEDKSSKSNYNAYANRKG